MKAVILAGGYGTRISEETAIRPKPMVEIGGQPILWHIMKIYSAHGINDFIICCGYKGTYIKDYFVQYFLHNADFTIDLQSRDVEVHKQAAEAWKVTLVDTGDKSMTGGRLKRVADHIGSDSFCLTYGDGLSSINIRELIAFHREQKGLATLTAVQPVGRFGTFTLEGGHSQITMFKEKPVGAGDGAWINGGFFVLEPEVLNYIDGDATVWELEPLERLAHEGQLHAYRFDGFWHPMDTLRDKNVLEELWQSGNPPWKVW